MPRLKIVAIENQEDRILLYPPQGRFPYHIIAKLGTLVHVGDVVEYEPYGINFGWFIQVQQEEI